MPCWPLWPPLSAASTSPSRSRHPRRPSSSCRQRAVLRRRVVLAPSIAVAPRCPSPLSRHRAVHRRPLPLRSRFIAVALVPSLAVHHRQGAVVQDYIEWPRQQYLVVPRHRRPSSGGARALAVARRWARTPPPRRVPRGRSQVAHAPPSWRRRGRRRSPRRPPTDAVLRRLRCRGPNDGPPTPLLLLPPRPPSLRRHGGERRAPLEIVVRWRLPRRIIGDPARHRLSSPTVRATPPLSSIAASNHC